MVWRKIKQEKGIDSEVEALNREVRGGLSEKVASEQRQEVRE